MSDHKTPWLALAAISLFTAYGLWQIAIRQPDPIQVRIIDLPPVTEAALLTSGIDRQTLNEFMEVRTALGRIKPAMTQISSQKQTRERNDGHSRANLSGPVAQRIERPRPKGKVAGSNPAWPANLTKAQLAAEVRAALPKLTAAEVDAAVWIIWRESGGRTTAKNPRSTSHGLNGFISRSWVSMTKRHGIKHSLEPRAQILALYHYCNDRYGSMSTARSFHRKRGWY